MDIESSVQRGLDKFFDFLPQLVGAVLLIIIGHFIAKIVQKIIRKALVRARFDRAIHVSPGGKHIARIIESPAQLIARIAYWVLFLLFISMAVSALNIPALNTLITGVYSYIPNVIAAIAIFLVASAITAGAEAFIRRVLGTGPLARIVGVILPVVTLSIAVFMILSQLQIAPDIVNITYTAILGSLSLGLALAFGLGGRDVAGEILRQAYDNARANKDTIASTARTAASRARGNES